MSDLIIVAFPDEATAFAAGEALVALQKQYLIEMEDVVVVTRDEEGRVKLNQSVNLTTGGAIGAETALKLADCVDPINAWAAAAKAVNPEVIVLCHGGPIATPEDAQTILRQCPGCHGFYGASSMERLPTETALTDTTRRFTQITR